MSQVLCFGTFAHLSLLQTRVLECLWKHLPVLPGCATSTNTIPFKIYQELIAGETVVEKHMVILPLQIFHQLLHHVCLKSFCSLLSLAGVHTESAKVAIGTNYLPVPTLWFHAWSASYCLRFERPWNLIIASSIATSLDGS